MTNLSLHPSRCTCIGLLVGLVTVFASNGLEASEPAAVSFSNDIQPILAKHCVLCHGPDEAEAGLRLDRAADQDAANPIESVIMHGDADASELLRRITTDDETERMPPDAEPLDQAEIDLLRQWINQGAEWEQHWAFRPVAPPAVPVHATQDWARNPIDAFVLAKLEDVGLSPSPAADRYTLIKRLYYDLLGLPPNPEAVEAFVNDDSADAYFRLVDELLASPHFGERWGRHWLDKARYADSDGYEKDRPRPHAWRYRDWVINAVNRDLPFDQFSVQQLAGDLLPDPTAMQRLATAFHRQTLTNTEGGADQEEFRVEATFDRTETTAAVWMGLTMTCARCHNHKYDQIEQQEYYQMFAFFNEASEVDIDMAKSEQAMQRYKEAERIHRSKVSALRREYLEARAELQPEIEAWQDEMWARFAADAESPTTTAAEIVDAKASLPEAISAAVSTPPEKRTIEQREQIADHVARAHPEVGPLAEQLTALESQSPEPPLMKVHIMVAADRETNLLTRGDFLQPAEKVDSGVLDVVRRVHPLETRRPGTPADRLDFARWLVEPAHPLTARVAVNHVWTKLFGRGIVSTVNDFGVRGELPTHPQLLDWLAWQFPREMGWSRKMLIRTIVNSAAYRQTAIHHPELTAADSTNRWFARQNRTRVEAEIVRDLQLNVGGLLSANVGGPSVFPPLPAGVAELSYANNFKWSTSEGADRYRRGTYTFFKRTSPHPTLISFDCPDSNTTRLQRESSNTPLQALATLNNDVFTEAAQGLARRILERSNLSDRQRLRFAIQLCIVRPPRDAELDAFAELLAASQNYYQAHLDDAETLTGRHRSDSSEVAENAAWVATARMIMNLDEFIVRD